MVGLENLLKLATIELHEELSNTPVLVVSKRLACVASSMGFSKIITANSANNHSIIAATTNWRHKESVQ